MDIDCSKLRPEFRSGSYENRSGSNENRYGSYENRYGKFSDQIWKFWYFARQKLKINMTDLQSWTTDKDMNTYMYLNYSRKEHTYIVWRVEDQNMDGLLICVRKEHTAGNLAFDLEGVQRWRKKL